MCFYSLSKRKKEISYVIYFEMYFVCVYYSVEIWYSFY